MLRITDHDPNNRLELTWQGPPPAWLIARWPVAIAVVGFWIFLAHQIVEMVRDESFLPRHWLGVPFIILIFGGLSLLPLLLFGRWTWFRADAAEGTLRGRQEDRFAFVPRMLVVHSRKLLRIDVEIEPHKLADNHELKLTLQFRDKPLLPLPTIITLRVERLEDPEKAKHLALEIGQALGWRGHRLVWEGPKKIEMELLPKVDPQTEAMPLEAAAARPEAAAVAPSTGSADGDRWVVGAFNPDRFEFDGYAERQVEWRPGQRVRIYRPPVSNLRLAIYFVGSGLIGAWLTAGVLYGIGFLTWWWLIPVGGLLMGWAVWSYSKERHGEREVVLDWTRGRATFDDETRGTHHVPLDQIQSITLLCERETEPSGNGRRHVYYCCEVQAILPDGPQRIARTRQCIQRMDAVRMAAPMAKSLSEFLGVVWRMEEHR